MAEASRAGRGAITVTGLTLPALKTLVQITFQAVMREVGVQSPLNLGFRAFQAAFAQKNKACFWPSSQLQNAQQGEHEGPEQLQPVDAVDGQPGAVLLLSLAHDLPSTQEGLLLPVHKHWLLHLAA
jgi:hypothetical protein